MVPPVKLFKFSNFDFPQRMLCSSQTINDSQNALFSMQQAFRQTAHLIIRLQDVMAFDVRGSHPILIGDVQAMDAAFCATAAFVQPDRMKSGLVP
eukprot:8306312-Pyramimonas_sp.AAC.2